MELENLGPPRAVKAAFIPYEFQRGSRAPLVTRTVALRAGGEARFTLCVPLISGRSDGRVVVVADPLPEDGGVEPDGRDGPALLNAAVPEFLFEAGPPRSDSNAIRSPSVLVLEGSPAGRGGVQLRGRGGSRPLPLL